MRRACRVTIKFATEKKRRKIKALLQAYRAAVNFYIKILWEVGGNLDKLTLAKLPSELSRLSARYRSQALKQAIDIVKVTKVQQKGVVGKVPVFKGSAILDSKFITVEHGKKSFDLIIKISSLQKGRRIIIPTKRTSILNKWLAFEGSSLIQGCALSEKGITLWVEIEDQMLKTEGDALGVDLGVNKLLTDSNGNFYGTDFKQLRDKIKNKKSGSKAKQRSIKEREAYIQKVVKKLPWTQLRIIAVENLVNLKKGKKKNRNKNFRKAMTPWTYRRVIEVIKQKAQQHRVDVVFVSPAYTSRTCPHCLGESKISRKGEHFHCIYCGYSNDADVVGAMNVLIKALSPNEECRVPRAQEETFDSV